MFQEAFQIPRDATVAGLDGQGSGAHTNPQKRSADTVATLVPDDKNPRVAHMSSMLRILGQSRKVANSQYSTRYIQLQTDKH